MSCISAGTMRHAHVVVSFALSGLISAVTGCTHFDEPTPRPPTSNIVFERNLSREMRAWNIPGCQKVNGRWYS